MPLAHKKSFLLKLCALQCSALFLFEFFLCMFFLFRSFSLKKFLLHESVFYYLGVCFAVLCTLLFLWFLCVALHWNSLYWIEIVKVPLAQTKSLYYKGTYEKVHLAQILPFKVGIPVCSQAYILMSFLASFQGGHPGVLPGGQATVHLGVYVGGLKSVFDTNFTFQSRDSALF